MVRSALDFEYILGIYLQIISQLVINIKPEAKRSLAELCDVARQVFTGINRLFMAH